MPDQDSKTASLPPALPGSGSLDRLVETARDYAAHAVADNTARAYAKDWAHYASWCRRRGVDPLGVNETGSPSAQLIGLYIAECAAPQDGLPGLSVSSIERRLSGLSWNFRQRGLTFDRKDRHIATVLAGIRRKHAKPPAQKEALLAEDIMEMIAALTFGLRDMRDRTIILLGYAGGLRRTEIVGLDAGPDETEDGTGWIEPVADDETGGGIILHINGKTGWREVEIGRGSSTDSCPVHALQQWLEFSKIAHGPVFRPVTRDSRKVTAERLSDKHVARLIKRLVLEAGIRADLPDEERVKLYSGHSLRAGLASSAEAEERHVQKHLGHSSAEMTRRYQRKRDRFSINLTKAAGL